MTDKKDLKLKPLAIALGAGAAISLAGTAVAENGNPFSTQELNNGYTILAEADTDGKCGADKGKDADGKCGSKKGKGADGKCGSE